MSDGSPDRADALIWALTEIFPRVLASNRDDRHHPSRLARKVPTSYVDDNAKSPLERHRAKLAGRNSGAHRQPMATEGTRYLGQRHRMEVIMHALETIETQAR